MFDAFGGLILGYASEIWGYTKSKEKKTNTFEVL